MKATITAFGLLLLLTTIGHGAVEPNVSSSLSSPTPWLNRSASIPLRSASIPLRSASIPLRAASIPLDLSLDVVHTVGVTSGGIPDTLTRYGKYLRRAGSQHWKLNTKKRERLSPGAEKMIPLPGKLGKARVSIDAKGVATVKIVDMKGKSLGTYRSSRFPLVIANNRLRIGGQPYVFILDRPAKK
ncbi:MAG: hypothetical protein HOI29_09005 [Planctomycetes bacterium]|jgi:hypothetical protein|nr:hypothetical protein [Planctomycetota bacterium]MBT7640883.1 hypothetical protein [Planctomycetota bacterium]